MTHTTPLAAAITRLRTAYENGEDIDEDRLRSLENQAKQMNLPTDPEREAPPDPTDQEEVDVRRQISILQRDRGARANWPADALASIEAWEAAQPKPEKRKPGKPVILGGDDSLGRDHPDGPGGEFVFDAKAANGLKKRTGGI